jgi:RNA polymerase-binding transcription factor DksA
VEERYESELASAAAVLDGVDSALERLSAGTYGACATCGAPMLDADLERDPAGRFCEQHLPLDELSTARSVDRPSTRLDEASASPRP